MHRGAWWATAHGVTESQTQLSDLHFIQQITYYSPILIPMFILVLDSHLNIINAYCQLFC